ncbi:MAG: P-loop NTPase family protein [Sulfobacillus sp.]
MTILECWFLQNPLMKFVVQHDVGPSPLVEHFSGIVEALRPVRSIVLYLAPPDIEGTIEQACRERPAPWRDGIVSYIVGRDYGRARGLHGWEGVLTFLRHRPELERDILAQLPIDTVTLADDIAPQRWDRVESLLSASFPLA